jgi:DNA-binding LacI/PurR family transcriptional regulator
VTTTNDVARVSAATVSRGLRGSELVRADKRQRVLGVIEAPGFVPDASAQAEVLPTQVVIRTFGGCPPRED